MPCFGLVVKMTDEADRADSRIEQMIADGMARARRQLEHQLPSIGVGHWCESPVGAGRIFCSKECSEDYDYQKQRDKANGK